MRRLSISDEEALYLLWACEEALLIAEPEEEEPLLSLISQLSGSAAPFSSASQRRQALLPGELPPPPAPSLSPSPSLPPLS